MHVNKRFQGNSNLWPSLCYHHLIPGMIASPRAGRLILPSVEACSALEVAASLNQNHDCQLRSRQVIFKVNAVNCKVNTACDYHYEHSENGKSHTSIKKLQFMLGNCLWKMQQLLSVLYIPSTRQCIPFFIISQNSQSISHFLHCAVVLSCTEELNGLVWSSCSGSPERECITNNDNAYVSRSKGLRKSSHPILHATFEEIILFFLKVILLSNSFNFLFLTHRYF